MNFAGIVRRAVWGARGRMGNRTPVQNRVIVHTEAGARILSSATEAQERQRMRNIDAFHLSLGWSGGFGYPFASFPSGRVYEGRSVRRPGAHTQGHNNQLAIVVPGHGDRDDITMACIRGIRRTIGAAVDGGDLVRSYRLTGHRDHIPPGQKSCPGNKIYPRLRELRHDAGSSAPTPPREYELGERTITTGDRGKDVDTLQWLINVVNSRNQSPRGTLTRTGQFNPTTAREVVYWGRLGGVNFADPEKPRVGINTVTALRQLRDKPIFTTPEKPEPEPEPEPEDIMATKEELRELLREELKRYATKADLAELADDVAEARAATRSQLNQAIRLGAAGAVGAIAAERKALGMPRNPVDDTRHAGWIREGKRPGREGRYDLEHVRSLLHGVATFQVEDNPVPEPPDADAEEGLGDEVEIDLPPDTIIPR